ncbi:hypothetical protein Tcan_02692 [Toxocara canis]|uniref:Uncharacterized protein n=1 Tax=Toxocara canis TaxID=6265 RepID=A0A0B2VCE9_TOXCA|nr:hypothetical protein Tcan_02692 [Toxocara canis]
MTSNGRRFDQHYSNRYKMGVEMQNTKSIDDIQTLGWYSAYICILAEILFITQVGNVNYMVYAGIHNR